MYKSIAGSLFEILHDVVSKEDFSNHTFQLRFWTTLLAIPLVAWKLPNISIKKLITPQETGNNCIFLSGADLFLKTYKERISLTELAQILPSYDLLDIPVPSALSFLANIIRIGMECPRVNPLKGDDFNDEGKLLLYL